jgi:hypothetical protein
MPPKKSPYHTKNDKGDTNNLKNDSINTDSTVADMDRINYVTANVDMMSTAAGSYSDELGQADMREKTAHDSGTEIYSGI